MSDFMRYVNDSLANHLRDIYNSNSWEPEDEDGAAELEGAFMERVADLTEGLNPADTMAAYEEAANLLDSLFASPIAWAL